MVVILDSKGFKLPRLEKEKFVNLLRLGLEYDRNQGLFSIKSYNNVEKLLDSISDILRDEVVFLQNCIRCGKAFSCKNCSYVELCTTKNLPFSCVCPQCLRDRKQFEEYLSNF